MTSTPVKADTTVSKQTQQSVVTSNEEFTPLSLFSSVFRFNDFLSFVFSFAKRERYNARDKIAMIMINAENMQIMV